MGHLQQDRRQRRTRQALRDALLGLLRERRYEAISVQDIVERADVARSTFYEHYLDKDDLLLGSQGVFTNPSQPTLPPDDADTAILAPARFWFAHIAAQKPALAAMAKDTALKLALENLREIIHEDIQKAVAARYPQDSPAGVPAAIIVEHLTGSLISLIAWWVAHDMAYTPEQMNDMFRRLALPGLAAIIGADIAARPDDSTV